MAELTVTGLPHLQAQWPGTSTGGKDTPASLQLGKRGEVLQALGAAAWQEKVGLRLLCLFPWRVGYQLPNRMLVSALGLCQFF